LLKLSTKQLNTWKLAVYTHLFYVRASEDSQKCFQKVPKFEKIMQLIIVCKTHACSDALVSL
jgi:hypothetical protein